VLQHRFFASAASFPVIPNLVIPKLLQSNVVNSIEKYYANASILLTRTILRSKFHGFAVSIKITAACSSTAFSPPTPASVCVRERERERERNKEEERQRDRPGQAKRQTDRHTHTQWARETEREKQRDRKRQRERKLQHLYSPPTPGPPLP